MAEKLSLHCTFPGCEFQTEVVEIAGAAALLTIHGLSHPRAINNTTQPTQPTQPPAAQPVSAQSSNAPKLPHLDRPKVSSQITPEEWNAFFRRWDAYKAAYNISDANATSQLFFCCSPQLGDVVLRGIPDFNQKRHY